MMESTLAPDARVGGLAGEAWGHGGEDGGSGYGVGGCLCDIQGKIPLTGSFSCLLTAFDLVRYR